MASRRPPSPGLGISKVMGHGEVEAATRFPLLHAPGDGFLNSAKAALHQHSRWHKRSIRPPPPGMIEGAKPSLMRFRLAVDDKLLLMSDGIAEANDADGHLFGFEWVQEPVRSVISAAVVAAAAQRLGRGNDISVISFTRTAVPEPGVP